jgi:pimeloyl-ACP methyl ester carboxylesterase
VRATSAACSPPSIASRGGASGLGEITVPTLVIHGDEDPFFPHRNVGVLAAEIPGATLLALPGIGQGVPRVTWPAVVDALLRHTS